MRQSTKLFVLAYFVSNVFLCSATYYKAIEQVSNWVDQNYTHQRTKAAANKKLDEIVNGPGTEVEKIQNIKKAFPEAFQTKKESLIYQPPISWRIHSLALGYDICETATQTTRAVDISKAIASKNINQNVTKKNDVSKQDKFSLRASGEANLSLNPLSWVSALVKGVNFSGSYAFGRNSINQTSELWTRTQQTLFSQERSYIEEITSQTNIKNFHLTFTVSVTNNGNDNISCDLRRGEAFIPVYGRSAFNAKAVPYKMPEKLEIPVNRTKDIIFRMELDTTNGRALATYMTYASPQIDILKGGQLRITNSDGKDVIGETINRVKTDYIQLQLPGFSAGWNIRRTHSDGKKVTLREALNEIAGDFYRAIDKSDIFTFGENDELMEVSSIPLGSFTENCRFITFLQVGRKIYDRVDKSMLEQSIPRGGCTIWVINMDNLPDYQNVNNELKQMICKKTEEETRRNKSAAQWYLAKIYLNGFGREKNYKQAVHWYRKAAEQGIALAQYMLGRCYHNGTGVTKDYEQAVHWLRKAAEQGYAQAQYDLGWCYDDGYGVTQDYEQAVHWYRKAAEQGDASAQRELGECFYKGYGVTQDYEQAVHWYLKAAEQGHALAQYNLGVCYYNGLGREENNEQAVHWYRKAAEQGYAPAQNKLGWFYYKGDGVTKDYEQAKIWFQRAAEQGYAPAKLVLNNFFKL